MQSTDMSAVTFIPITSEYARSTYADFEVVVQMSTGYINASKLCGLAMTKAGKQKEFSRWQRNDTAQRLISAVAKELGMIPSMLLREVRDVCIQLRGTYVHHMLVLDIITWADAAFYVKAAVIVNACVARHIVNLAAAQESQLRAQSQRIAALEDALDAREELIIDSSPQAGYVYFIISTAYTADGAVKIGHAVNPQSRLKRLQTGNVATLSIYKQIHSSNRIQLERDLHQRFKHRHIRGEWYNLLLSEVDELTIEIA
jgi:hypothetical protein